MQLTTEFHGVNAHGVTPSFKFSVQLRVALNSVLLRGKKSSTNAFAFTIITAAKNFIAVVVIPFVVLTGCSQPSTENTGLSNKSGTRVDTAQVVVIPFDSTKHTPWIKGGKKTNLTEEEFELLEATLQVCVSNYNVAANSRYEEHTRLYPNQTFEKDKYVLNIDKYKRQYIPFTNEQGEKKVWVNCYCSSEPTVSKDVVYVLDGGNCYFNLIINITNKDCFDFFVNGEA